LEQLIAAIASILYLEGKMYTGTGMQKAINKKGIAIRYG
jgi:hypothetical protein